jgi:hypothetical protein
MKLPVSTKTGAELSHSTAYLALAQDVVHEDWAMHESKYGMCRSVPDCK